MEHQVFGVVEESREGLKTWILILSFPFQGSDHILWCILYLKAKHWDNNLDNLVLPIIKSRFSYRIWKKKNRRVANLSPPSAAAGDAFTPASSFPGSSAPPSSNSCCSAQGYLTAADLRKVQPFIRIQRDEGDSGMGYSPKRVFTSKWWSWLRWGSDWGRIFREGVSWVFLRLWTAENCSLDVFSGAKKLIFCLTNSKHLWLHWVDFFFLLLQTLMPTPAMCLWASPNSITLTIRRKRELGLYHL